MRIAFCGYDFFVGCLDALVADGHEIVALFSEDSDNEYNFNKEMTTYATDLGLPIKYAPITEVDVERLDAMGCDVLVSAAYSHKIPNLDDTGIKGINIHPTKLPEGRGPWPLPHLILKEKTETALTFHKITQQWDGGDILHQVPVGLCKTETIESLSVKLQMVAPNALLDVLDGLEDAWAQATPQAEGEYWPMLRYEDGGCDIDPSETVEVIDRTVRAFGKMISRLILDGVVYDVERVNVWQEAHDFECGEVVHSTAREFVFAAKGGFVCVTHYKVCES